MVPEGHPLQTLFLDLVAHHYMTGVGLYNPEISEYVATILTDFCEVEQLYKIRDAGSRPLHDVGAAVRCVRSVTVTVPTVIPAPKLTPLVPCTKVVFCAVIVTERFCCPG